MYNNNASTTNSIIAKKKAQGLVMNHPECPEDDSMELHWATCFQPKLQLAYYDIAIAFHIDSLDKSYQYAQYIEVLISLDNINEAESAESMQMEMRQKIDPDSQASTIP